MWHNGSLLHRSQVVLDWLVISYPSRQHFYWKYMYNSFDFVTVFSVRILNKVMTNITILKCNQNSLSIIVFFCWMCSLSCSCPLGYNSLNFAPIFRYNLCIAPLGGALVEIVISIYRKFVSKTSSTFFKSTQWNLLHLIPMKSWCSWHTSFKA